MDQLWAPWRMAYVAKDDKKRSDDFIAFADLDSNDRENLVVYRSRWSIVILNRFPYNNGHLLVAPRRAVAELEQMTDVEMLDCQRVLRHLLGILRQLMNPDGFNVGLNLGRAAGAGLPQHLHWHIVPRWNGDTNFMTLMTDTRVIVQSLDELWKLLSASLEANPL